MLSLAPRPKARADGSRLPVTGESVDAVAALLALYHYGGSGAVSAVSRVLPREESTTA